MPLHPFLTNGGASAMDLKALFDLRRPPGYCNATAKVALLRRARGQPHDQLLVNFSGPSIEIALQAEGLVLLEGAWTWQAMVAGQPLAAIGTWEESCWHRDGKCDYLEVELRLAGGWRLERQMLLSRRERFLFLGDALIAPGCPSENDSPPKPNGSPLRTIPAGGFEIRHTFSLPLASGIKWSPAPRTREGWLTDSRRRASIVPPTLPEWRAEFSHSELAAEEGRLSIQQAALGCNLYVPLWIDLDPSRLRRPLTWRRLTVAENLEVVPRDVAVAYRLQAGREQWLFYRSLAPRGNRTFLGQNYSSEFACCRFLPSGEADEILAIE